jgi:hypothetical protein
MNNLTTIRTNNNECVKNRDRSTTIGRFQGKELSFSIN